MIKQDVKKIKEANREFFDKLGSDYSKKRRISFGRKSTLRLIQRYEKAMGKKFKPVENFLDFGCGSGFILLNLASAGFISKSYGIDISLEMLKECKRNAVCTDMNVFLTQGDAEYLPFNSNSFDFIIGHAILHHLPGIDKALKEIHRVLKPQGACIFTEPSRTGSRIIATIQWFFWFIPFIIRRFTKTKQEKMVEIDTFTVKKLEQSMQKAGFLNVYTRPFAGFISRIFYWIMDPFSQRISNKYYHLIVDKIVDTLSLLDEYIFTAFIPKSWFDEVFILVHK